MHGRTPQWTQADRLRKARKDAGLSPEELAAELRVTPATVRNYEGERTHPNYSTLMAWATICDVDPLWIETGVSSDQKAEAERLVDHLGEAVPAPSFLRALASPRAGESRCSSLYEQRPLPGLDGTTWIGAAPLFSRAVVEMANAA